jgi:triacylglycerol lipase
MDIRFFLILFFLISATSAKPPAPDFDTGAAMAANPSVDFPEILTYALLSHFVYKPDSVIARYYTAQDISIGTLPSEKVKFLIVKDTRNNIQTVAIQGTKNFHNVILDMEFSERIDPLLGVRLHRGFEHAARELYDRLILTDALDKTKPVVITGHSLGGAVGVILALYLQKTGFTIRKVVTFGQPRITDVIGARQFDLIPLLRIVNSQDVIPGLPPEKKTGTLSGSRYIHFGQEVVLLKDQFFAYRENPEPSSAVNLSLWQDLTEENLKEHHLRNYLSNIVMKLSKPHQVALSELGHYQDREDQR